MILLFEQIAPEYFFEYMNEGCHKGPKVSIREILLTESTKFCVKFSRFFRR